MFTKVSNDLFSKHQLLSLQLAKKMFRTTPPQITLDELHAAALEGLWKAVKSWDSKRGASFKSHAYTVITRTMINWLRHAHWRKDSQQSALHLNYYEDESNENYLTDKKNFLDALCTKDILAWELAKLSSSLRRLLVGYFIDGYSVREMASLYKMSPANIYALLQPYRQRAGVSRNQSSYAGA